MNQHHTQEVARHYDRNTHRFLALGQHSGIRNIHQPLWPPGVTSLKEASGVSNEMVLTAARDMIAAFGGPIQVLDLGCGVGSTALYLGHVLGESARVHGITISGEQVSLAREFARRENLEAFCSFEQGDFLNLDQQPQSHLIYAIEAFLHGPDPAAFFQAVSRRLVPGGRLMLIDDFLLAEKQPVDSRRIQRWLADFQEGWLAGSLITDDHATELAVGSGLRMIDDQNLTPWMKLGRPRDQLIGLARLFARKSMQRSTYWRALSGGYAKQQCLKHGILAYRMIMFQRM